MLGIGGPVSLLRHATTWELMIGKFLQGIVACLVSHVCHFACCDHQTPTDCNATVYEIPLRKISLQEGISCKRKRRSLCLGDVPQSVETSALVPSAAIAGSRRGWVCAIFLSFV